MKKILLVVGIVSLMVSCDKSTSTKETSSAPVNESEFKTAYIDTEKLMKEYQESIDFEAKYKSMSERIQNELSSDMKKFQSDVQDLQRSAQSKGMEWAQKREAELTRRQQTLAEKEQNYMKKFQEEGAVERDSLVSKMKTFIKGYGKEKGYDYVFGTGDAATVLYAKDGYEITEDILKIMNEEYAKSKGTANQSGTKTETATEAKK